MPGSTKGPLMQTWLPHDPLSGVAYATDTKPAQHLGSARARGSKQHPLMLTCPKSCPHRIDGSIAAGIPAHIAAHPAARHELGLHVLPRLHLRASKWGPNLSTAGRLGPALWTGVLACSVMPDSSSAFNWTVAVQVAGCCQDRLAQQTALQASVPYPGQRLKDVVFAEQINYDAGPATCCHSVWAQSITDHHLLRVQAAARALCSRCRVCRSEDRPACLSQQC